MNEFKGTKGKWERVTSDWDMNQSVFLENTEIEICSVKSNAHKQLYDAQLIAHAPELLDFIKSIVEDYNNGLIDDVESVAIRSESLYNKATTI